MEYFNSRRVTRIGVAAALYFVLTVAPYTLSYNDLQFRLSEALMLLCFFNKDYIIAMSMGCFIANLFSPMPIDILFGTVATVVAAIPMYLLRKRGSLIRMVICSLFPVISNTFIIALEMQLFMHMPYWISAAEIAVGEFVCVTLIGVALFSILQKSEAFMKYVASEKPQAKA